MRADPFVDADLTLNAFLGGKVSLHQPTSGYRAGIDPVLLASAIPAQPGQSVLELGTGSGVALLCLSARVANLTLTGVELQPGYADLARRNALANGVNARIVTADLADLPHDLRADSFDHVFANPPYFKHGARRAAEDAGREAGRAEDVPLADWVRQAARRTRPGGIVTMICAAERLPDLLTAFSACLASVVAKPISSRPGRAAKLVLLQATKGKSAATKGAPFRLLAPFVLHNGPNHMADGDDYGPVTSAILRDGAAFPWEG